MRTRSDLAFVLLLFASEGRAAAFLRWSQLAGSGMASGASRNGSQVNQYDEHPLGSLLSEGIVKRSTATLPFRQSAIGSLCRRVCSST